MPDPTSSGPTTAIQGLESVGDAFSRFAAELQCKREPVIARIAQLTNGFEGWLKIEFLLWLVEQGLELNKGVGVEHRAKIDAQHAEMGRQEKLCDLWLASTSLDRYHYVELKAPFANRNQGKVLRSAGHDLWYVSRLEATYEKAATGNAIVVGVGFDEPAWRQAEAQVTVAAACGAPGHSGELCPSVWWSVWTHRYDAG